MNRKQSGDRAETLACHYLERRGLRLLTRNFHCRRGEIDLVMHDGDSLVFVEVRYRRQTRFGLPAETVSRDKQARIIHCASYWLTLHRGWNEAVRFDVVAIAGSPDEPSIEWLTNAFQAGG